MALNLRTHRPVCLETHHAFIDSRLTDAIRRLQVGDTVKMSFEVDGAVSRTVRRRLERQGIPLARMESMGVRVTRIQGEGTSASYQGVLVNTPVLIDPERLACGDTLEFTADPIQVVFPQELARQETAANPATPVDDGQVSPRTASGKRRVQVCVGDVETETDEDLAPVIEELGRAGLRTLNSSLEYRSEKAWIVFLEAGYAAQFLNIVADYDTARDSLYNRICRDGDPMAGALPAPYWVYAAHPTDASIHDEIGEDNLEHEWQEGPSRFFFTMAVEFPCSDLPTVLDRLRRYNSAPGQGGSQ